ncbi:hypothetical protein [Actinosynnema sp. NPDC023587]|uniref:hypothetical protein n=1 Tax=Actinosynnema sp. NPDC023587 TaxID=3154695 RepID=UPI0033EE0455
MNTRKRATLEALERRMPLTWQGILMVLCAVALLGIGVYDLSGGEAGNGVVLILCGVFSVLLAVFFFRGARRLRSLRGD